MTNIAAAVTITPASITAFKNAAGLAAGSAQAQAPDKETVQKVVDFLVKHEPKIVGALASGISMPRAPGRGPIVASEASQVLRAAGGIDAAAAAADALHGIMARTSPLLEGVYKAAANGTVESPERIKAGTEFAAVRTEVQAFFADVFGAQGGVELVVGGLAALRASGRLDSGETPALSAKLEDTLALNNDELVEKTRTDALMSMMVMLMGLLMLMKEMDRNLSAAALQKAESFVAQAGERLVQGAEEHKKGAVTALATSATIATAGVGVSAAGAVKQTKSIQNHTRQAIKRNELADSIDYGVAKGQARAGGTDGLTSAQSRSLGATELRNEAKALEVKGQMSATQNSLFGESGRAAGQLAGSAGNIAQADADVNAAEKTRLQQNLQKASETAKAESDHAKQRADEQGSMQSQIESKMSSILDESHGALDAINRNMA